VSILNLGILAHVDAGKTTLTERLLYDAGVIDAPGSVDDGSTQTDFLDLERKRGITIKSAVVSFVVGDVTINLIDTPGHPDFIAEVERVLDVLDGAVLVVSAVEGVQAQTRVLWRTLQRLRIATLVFVNKSDRAGARFESVSEQIAAKLGEAPTFLGSARTGAGVDRLTAAITELLPHAGGDPGGPVAGTVFKIDRGPRGERIAYVRMRSGTLRTRDRLEAGKVTAISVFERGSDVRRPAVAAGQIAKLWGLGDVRIGDAIGVGAAGSNGHHFAPPTLETIVVPARPSDRGALHAALTQLAEQDPLIALRQTEDELALSLYGEVQKEVIEATLAADYGVDVVFRETTTICIERVSGTGSAAEILGADSNPYLATVGLRVEPGRGVAFRLEVELGSMPSAFFNAVEETVHATLAARRVTDCVVTMTHSGYAARQSHSHGTFDKSMSSTAGDFRDLTPIVLDRALAEAGTTAHEPLHRFHLEAPADAIGQILPVLGRLQAVPGVPEIRGGELTLRGEIPVANVHELRRQLPALTRGEGVLETEFAGYRPSRGA
jgi:ribosomal protection tetracycline resistance protein